MRLSKVLKWLGVGAWATLVIVIVAPFALLTLDAVWPVRFRDVPDAPHIGERCVVLKGLRAHGVYKVGGTRDKTDWVTITTLPGFSGNEVTFKEDIPKGTTFVVTECRSVGPVPSTPSTTGCRSPASPK
jgi:hypothetical protein